MLVIFNILFAVLGICLAAYAYSNADSCPGLKGVTVFLTWTLAQIVLNYII